MNFNLTLLGQAISLGIFVYICMEYIWPHIINGLKERQKRVADGLAAADEGQQKLDKAQARSHELLEESKQQAADIIAQAQKRGDEIVDEAKEQAVAEGERLITAAQAEIEQERIQAREQLKDEVAALAVSAAEQVLMREVDRDAHNEVLNKISARL